MRHVSTVDGHLIEQTFDNFAHFDRVVVFLSGRLVKQHGYGRAAQEIDVEDR